MGNRLPTGNELPKGKYTFGHILREVERRVGEKSHKLLQGGIIIKI